MTPRARGRRRLGLTLACYGAVLAIAALDHFVPLATTRHTDAWIGIVLAIASVIWDGIQAAADVAMIALQWLVHALWIMVASLAHTVSEGFWLAAKFAGKALDYIKVAWDRALKPFLNWAYKKLYALEQWVKLKLAPVLQFLERVKAAIDQIYKGFVKPIVDTIEFLRALNRVLEAFHITVLAKLDEVLQQIEQRLEDPFLWVRAKITWVENWIDRIVTFDGLFQRITLLASMAKHAPEWLNIGANFRHRPLTSDEAGALARGSQVTAGPALARDLTAYIHGGRNETGDVIDALVQQMTADLRRSS